MESTTRRDAREFQFAHLANSFVTLTVYACTVVLVARELLGPGNGTIYQEWYVQTPIRPKEYSVTLTSHMQVGSSGSCGGMYVDACNESNHN
jgi:hypothetical protein